MRVPVLLRIPKQDSLRESATVALESRIPELAQRVPPLDVSRIKAPPGIVLDAEFPAIPTGTGDRESTSLESTTPEASETFVVRGFVDVEDIERFSEPQEDGSQAFADPEIDVCITCIGDPPVGTAADVATKLNVTTLGENDLNGKNVAVAIMDTGINLQHLVQKLGTVPGFDFGNSWSPAGSATLPGQYPVHHGTMCAYDVLIAAPKATLLDFPILLPSAAGGTVMGRRLSVALVAYAQLLAMWGVAFDPSGQGRYNALVVNNSWAMFHDSWDFPAGHPGRYADNPNHPFNVIVSTLANTGADVVFAAGNCGVDCPDYRCQDSTAHTIRGANALNDVLTLAGCDTNDHRVGYSSQGPAINGMGADKPDLTAYTHFLGSEAFGPGEPDGGTSTACPVAAGCIAALRTKALPAAHPPSSVFATLRTTSRPIGGPWSGDIGFGIIDPLAAGQSMGVI